ncbi:MAG: hypothetical protein H0V49_02575 [Nocardioidaceae bacterium]|nr:hypothetical protein [Nocardioidaceae bacterium]
MSSQSLDVLGKWWLPGHEGHRVTGRLTWDVVEGGTLEMLGELRPIALKDNVLPDGSVQKYREPLTKVDQQYPMILGEVDDEGYTLLGSWSLNGRGFHRLREHRERVCVNGVLVGAWYTDGDDLQADRAVFDIRHLTTWVDDSGVKTTYPRVEGEPNGPWAIVTAKHRRTRKIGHGDLTVKLWHHFDWTGDGEWTHGIAESWKLTVESKTMSDVDALTNVAVDVRALVTIAAGKSAEIEKVVLQHPAVASTIGSPPRSIREDISYYSRWSHRAAEEPPARRQDLYFDLMTFGGIRGLGRWLTVARKYPTELRRVMATRYTGDMYVEDRIMNTCAALESFDGTRRRNRRREDVEFADRITACVKFAPPQLSALLVEDMTTWVAAVVRVRNQVAHHGHVFRETGTAGEHLLAEQLYWLFVMCMLRVSGAPDAVFDSIGCHGQIRWLTEQARERPAT